MTDPDPDDGKCSETTHRPRRRWATPQCSFYINSHRAAMVSACYTVQMERGSDARYSFIILSSPYDTHTTSLGGLVCNTEQPAACKQRSHVTCSQREDVSSTTRPRFFLNTSRAPFQNPGQLPQNARARYRSSL